MQKQGNVETDEMYHTFNMGIGLAMVVKPEHAAEILASEELKGFDPVVIGAVASGSGKVVMEY